MKHEKKTKAKEKEKDEKSCLKIHHAKEFFIKFLYVVMCCLLNLFPRSHRGISFREWWTWRRRQTQETKKGLQRSKDVIIQDDSWGLRYVNFPSIVGKFYLSPVNEFFIEVSRDLCAPIILKIDLLQRRSGPAAF